MMGAESGIVKAPEVAFDRAWRTATVANITAVESVKPIGGNPVGVEGGRVRDVTVPTNVIGQPESSIVNSSASGDAGFFENQDGGMEPITIGFNEIKEIIVYIPANNYRNTITFLSMEDFSYARFELQDGRKFYITCLMVPKLKLKDFIQNTFSGIPVDFHRWWIFPSIRLVNYFRRKKKQESVV